jgi:prepilin-type N-terminal cleavage/methylation domain-containing protein
MQGATDGSRSGRRRSPNVREGEQVMERVHGKPRRGFSLIELVIVVVIIGIIAAIAIPRMSRGTAGAGDSAVSGNLNVLRNAIELYASEHSGAFPSGDADNVTSQLTQYTNDAGGVSATKVVSTGHIYGPYLRKLPPVTVGTLKSKDSVNAKIAIGTTIETTPTGGWLYDPATGNVKINLANSEVDQSSKSYNAY